LPDFQAQLNLWVRLGQVLKSLAQTEKRNKDPLITLLILNFSSATVLSLSLSLS
jgi:hypothetical protein